MMSQTSRAGGLFFDFERERGVTLVLIFLCAYVLHRRKKHQRNTIRLRSHRIPLFQNELEGMTPSQPRSPRLQFPFLFECTKNIRTNTHHSTHAPPDRKTSTTRSARRLVAHRAVDDAAAALKKRRLYDATSPHYISRGSKRSL